MMHGREKSDPAIGAGKPTNKAEASAHAAHGVSDAAELVEQRAGAKGNADEQSTHRTQGRERVSQALDRVRKAARLKKDEKFTALLHHINLDLMLPRFGGHPNTTEGGGPNAENASSLCARIQAANGRAGPSRTNAWRAG